MSVRTISREAHNSRVVLVWPKGVGAEDISTNDDGNQYAKLDGAIVQPVTIPADTFKAAFGFVPNSGSMGRYAMRKAVAPQSLADRLVGTITEIVKAELGDND
jgi:hypothetical protein